MINLRYTVSRETHREDIVHIKRYTNYIYNKSYAYTHKRKWYATWHQLHKKQTDNWSQRMLRTFFDTSNGEHLRAVHVSAARLKNMDKPIDGCYRIDWQGWKEKGWECNGVGKNKRRPLKNGRNPTLPHLNQNKREQVSTQPNWQHNAQRTVSTKAEQIWKFHFYFWFFKKGWKIPQRSFHANLFT